MQSEQLFEAALGVAMPWFVREARFDGEARSLTIQVDFRAGSRFSHPECAGEHPVHDTQTKRYRHLNFFQHECFLEVRVPRVKLPDGSARLIEPRWAGKLSGFTLLFEPLVLCLCRDWLERTGTGWRRSPNATWIWRSRRRTSRRCGNWRSTKPRRLVDTTT